MSDAVATVSMISMIFIGIYWYFYVYEEKSIQESDIK